MQQTTANLPILSDETAMLQVEQVWSDIAQEFDKFYELMPEKPMARTELTFHPFVKLLGYLCISLADVPGDIVEIGVWKGRSLALMDRLSSSSTKIVGIDPCAQPGQEQELTYFQERIFPATHVIVEYSERAVANLTKITKHLKILHIDGGHDSYNVWADFLLYERFVVPGGYVIFDDYEDAVYSPDVKVAVNEMNARGLFRDFEVIGPVTNYENSFLLRRRVVS